MKSSTHIILDETQQEKKTVSKPTHIDMTKVSLLEKDLDSPHLKRSPRLEKSLRMPSPPRREEEMKDIKRHDEVITKRRSSGSFSTSIRTISPVITAPPNSPASPTDEAYVSNHSIKL